MLVLLVLVSGQMLVGVLLLVMCTSICADADIGVLVLVLEVTGSVASWSTNVQTKNLF